ncbi:MAG TPA: glutamate--tRNA ligase [Mycobacteriales bacterium]|nr:glutamate--tRNA ligase [Mycobacteriales bacterium]
MSEVRTRFAPAPSGDLHVGNVRTGLFSWAVARQAGGKFVYRIEDTDASRATDEAFHAAVDVLRWLGLDWDEGPVVGGPHAPYRQSERFEVYAGVVAQLQESGHAYPCYCSPEDVTARKAARGDKTPGYDGFCRDRVDVPEGVAPTMRFRMPEGSTTWDDLVRGAITIEHKDVPDFTILRSNGHPLYMLAATVDDVLMGLTHIIRGEDLIAATPRQMAMYAAMGVAREDFPRFAHLPLIVGDDGKPLSKRNGEVSIAWYRRNGFLPEAMLNYLALLGWSLPGSDDEVFTSAEMVAAFDVTRVSRNPARFDLKKLEAINGEHIRRLSEGDLAARLVPVLQNAGVLPDAVPDDLHERLREAIPLVQTRLARLTEAPDLLRFLFVSELTVDPAAAAKSLVGESLGSLTAAEEALAGLASWTAPEIEAALRAALVDGLGLKPKHAFGPLRVAVTGRTVSPPLFESMELLGRDTTLARVRAAVADVRGY